MVAVFFSGSRQQQQFGGLRFAERRQAAHGELTGGQRAGFVEDKGVDFGGGLNVRHVLDQNSEARGGGKRGHHRGGCRQNESARAGNHKHRDDAVQLMRKRPDQRANDQHQRRVKTHVLIHDFLDRQFGLFRGDDQFPHPAECGVFDRPG